MEDYEGVIVCPLCGSEDCEQFGYNEEGCEMWRCKDCLWPFVPEDGDE